MVGPLVDRSDRADNFAGSGGNAYFHEPASQLAKHHQALDALVLKAYGWKASEDILSNLLDLNLELAEREAAGEKVVGPWAPA
jgi:hypothetical protein